MSRGGTLVLLYHRVADLSAAHVAAGAPVGSHPFSRRAGRGALEQQPVMDIDRAQEIVVVVPVPAAPLVSVLIDEHQVARGTFGRRVDGLRG